MKRLIFAAVALAIMAPPASAEFPVGFEVKGGIGVGYYSMGEFNDHLAAVREATGQSFEDLTSGFNVMAEGRVWMFGRLAATAGYERFWAEQLMTISSSDYVTYEMPADILSLGGAVHIYRIPKVIDINAGAKGIFCKPIIGTDQDGSWTDYKSTGYGWDLFGEVNTNFLNPLQVGFTLGYRHCKIEDFEDKFGNTPEFSGNGAPMVMDYSGVYFYFTAGVAIW